MLQIEPLETCAAFERMLASRLLNRDAPHGLGRRRKEMSTAVEPGIFQLRPGEATPHARARWAATCDQPAPPPSCSQPADGVPRKRSGKARSQPSDALPNRIKNACRIAHRLRQGVTLRQIEIQLQRSDTHAHHSNRFRKPGHPRLPDSKDSRRRQAMSPDVIVPRRGAETVRRYRCSPALPSANRFQRWMSQPSPTTR